MRTVWVGDGGIKGKTFEKDWLRRRSEKHLRAEEGVGMEGNGVRSDGGVGSRKGKWI